MTEGHKRNSKMQTNININNKAKSPIIVFGIKILPIIHIGNNIETNCHAITISNKVSFIGTSIFLDM